MRWWERNSNGMEAEISWMKGSGDRRLNSNQGTTRVPDAMINLITDTCALHLTPRHPSSTTHTL